MKWIDANIEPPKIGEYLCIKFTENKKGYYVGSYFRSDGNKGMWFCDELGDPIYLSECDKVYWLKED